MIQRHPGKPISIASSLLVLISLAGFAYAKRQAPDEPPFQYVAGTEDLAQGCAGKLEVLKDGLAFACPAGTLDVPFAAITLMQYRPDVSKQVLRMNIAWKVQPPVVKRLRDNEYFAVLYTAQGAVHAIVLKVEPLQMRPYLAEIELKSGKSVQVYRSYGEFD
jgi:hypothetical protein